jgi:putative serine protease PepD
MVRLTAVVAAAVVGGLAFVARSSSGATTSAAMPAMTASTAPSGSALRQTLVKVVNQVRPAVVEISTSSGLGSGVVFDAQGDIVTNYQVVGTATQFQVTFFGGQTVAGTLVGTFAPDDLAVIRAPLATGVVAATFANSAQLQIGDIALAIGNSVGLASSVTEGIVSFNGRTVPEGNGVVLPDTVQTSAAINPANSGGALVNLSGQVIGIPTLAATDQRLGGGGSARSGSGGGGPGIGFAIPSNTANSIAGQLVTRGKVTNSGRAALGITGATW